MSDQIAFEQPLSLVSFEYRGRLTGGQTRPLLVAAMDDDGREYLTVLKVRKPREANGHYEGTSLACELICSVLARYLGLPVPDYAIVDVRIEFAHAVPDHATRELLKNNVGPNFGCIYHQGYALWNSSYQPRDEDLCGALEDTLTYDATVINGDRSRAKPNLLARGNNLLLIDHSLALPMHLWNDVDASTLFPDEHIKKHCTFSALHDLHYSYERLLAEWCSNLDRTAMRRLRAMIPGSWEKRPGDLDKVFAFLEGRASHAQDISMSLQRAVG